MDSIHSAHTAHNIKINEYTVRDDCCRYNSDEAEEDRLHSTRAHCLRDCNVEGSHAYDFYIHIASAAVAHARSPNSETSILYAT